MTQTAPSKRRIFISEKAFNEELRPLVEPVEKYLNEHGIPGVILIDRGSEDNNTVYASYFFSQECGNLETLPYLDPRLVLTTMISHITNTEQLEPQVNKVSKFIHQTIARLLRIITFMQEFMRQNAFNEGLVKDNKIMSPGSDRLQ